MPVYFDNAATTPLRPEVVEAISAVMADTFGNPSSTHSYGREAKALIETARKSIASHFNALPQEIIFTSGGTESDNMLLRCAVKDLGVQTLISSPLEHHAILHALDELESEGLQIKYVNHSEDGTIDLVHLEALLTADDSKKLVTLMYVNNEIGNILDLYSVGNLCHQHKALFHTDAVQGVAHFRMDTSQLPVDFFSAAAHKFHGPKGVGFSFVRKNSGIKPFIVGGGQERGLRAGTESVHNIVGMAKALEIAYAKLDEEYLYIRDIKRYFITQLTGLFPNLKFNGCSGDLQKSTYTLVNVQLPVPEDKAVLLDFHLDLKGVACSKGSACQSGSNAGSHVIKALNPRSGISHPSLRFSFSSFNTKEDVDYAIAALNEFVAGQVGV